MNNQPNSMNNNNMKSLPQKGQSRLGSVLAKKIKRNIELNNYRTVNVGLYDDPYRNFKKTVSKIKPVDIGLTNGHVSNTIIQSRPIRQQQKQKQVLTLENYSDYDF